MTQRYTAPHFDADEVRAAQVEPTLTIGNLLYRGRLLSAPEWFAWSRRIDELKKQVHVGDAKDEDALLAFYEEYFRDLFPRTRFRFWAPDPVTALMRQPLGVIEEAFARFFLLQAQANGVTRTASPSTSGTDSSDSTLLEHAAAPAGVAE